MIFASGYDTFAMRNTDESFSVYELDLPEMIADKTDRIERSQMSSKAIYVPCDLAEETWKDRLTESGYCRKQKSFGSLLGISYYLSKQDFEKLLKNISDVMAEESIICFDYPLTDESDATKKNQMLASGAGEQMKALYSCSEIKALLQKCGFKLAEHLSDAEMTARYFAEYNASNPTYPMQAPKGVAYAAARKI